jgi:hypothetical protein
MQIADMQHVRLIRSRRCDRPVETRERRPDAERNNRYWGRIDVVCGRDLVSRKFRVRNDEVSNCCAAAIEPSSEGIASIRVPFGTPLTAHVVNRQRDWMHAPKGRRVGWRVEDVEAFVAGCARQIDEGPPEIGWRDASHNPAFGESRQRHSCRGAEDDELTSLIDTSERAQQF